MPGSIDAGVWAAFFSENPQPCFLYEVGTTPRFRLVAANSAWHEATGIPSDGIGAELGQLMPEEVRALVSERFERCLGTGMAQVFTEELRFGARVRYWRTHLIPRISQGSTHYIIGLAQDLTELRDAAAALASSEAKFERIVENARDVIYRLRLEPSIGFDYISPSIERVTGYPPQAFYENYALLRDLVHPDDQATIERVAAQLREEVGVTLVRWIHRDGSMRWMEARSSLVTNASGKVVAREGIARDVTEQKRRDDETALLERRLQQTQKLESLGVLAGGIAHDFNNLLTGILGHASLLRVEGGSDLLEHAQQIELAAIRAADLCRQMLAYSGKGRFSIQRVELDALVRETTQLLKLSIAKSTDLRLDLQAGSSTEADATQLQQVVMNLVLNASEACEGRPSRVTVTTGTTQVRRGELRDAFLAPDLPEGRYLFVDVIDNGIGMTPDTQSRIFDPFFTTKFTGRGLGLSAVLGIVRGHSGAIRVTSQPGRGTTFRVLLPASDQTSASVVAVKREAPARGKGYVLVADDEEIVRTVTSRILEVLGYRVVTARDGYDAVEAFRASTERIDAVLMDLTMPKLDGVAAFQELRRLNPEIPVILMSGYDEQDAVARFAGSGLAGFLQKPFTAESLSGKLGGALRLR